jgi:hypothetical protein
LSKTFAAKIFPKKIARNFVWKKTFNWNLDIASQNQTK